MFWSEGSRFFILHSLPHERGIHTLLRGERIGNSCWFERKVIVVRLLLVDLLKSALNFSIVLLILFLEAVNALFQRVLLHFLLAE